MKSLGRRFTYASLLFAAVLAQPVYSQLVVTEVMFDSASSGDGAWEWIEVENTGGSAVDLNGAYAGKLGGGEVPGPVVDSSALNSVIPAGGVAVIYDANFGVGNPSSFNDQQFRDAWGLGAGVPLIGATNLPALSNSGALTNFAFWPDFGTYSANLTLNNETNDFEITSLNNTLFDLDYSSAAGFPTGNNSASIRWSGNGDAKVGSNWARSEVGQTNVVTSLEVSVAGNTNSTDDIGNPGVFPAGPAVSGLLISEIMYNPRSPEGSTGMWEWVEIFNNTGAEINFGTTNYVLDDDDGGAIGAANLNSGSIADGGTAILYNADQLGFLDIQGAWDPNGTKGTNFIGVVDWPGFGNGDDVVALWDASDQTKFDAYTADRVADVTTNAEIAVLYDDDPIDPVNPWPQDDGNGSIYLTDLNADPNVGANWVLSPGGSVTSFNAAGLSGNVVIHPGGDVGSPGSFDTVTVADVDLDNDGDIDGADFLLIQRDNPSLIPDWVAQYPAGASLSAATAVPEPTSIVLLGLAAVFLSCGVRKQ